MPPQALVMWLEAVKGTADGMAKFRSSVRNFAAVTGRRKVLAMLQQHLLGPYLVSGGEVTTERRQRLRGRHVCGRAEYTWHQKVA